MDQATIRGRRRCHHARFDQMRLGTNRLLAVDLSATLLFALEGGLVAVDAQLDVFGVFVLAFATSLVRPGAIAHEIDSAVRDYMRKAGYPVYGHHTGHGVGVTGHEEPRLVPYNDMRIEPGMVIMVEPGIYYPDDTAIRLEDALLVTDTSVEVLTKHDKSA